MWGRLGAWEERTLGDAGAGGAGLLGAWRHRGREKRALGDPGVRERQGAQVGRRLHHAPLGPAPFWDFSIRLG